MLYYKYKVKKGEFLYFYFIKGDFFMKKLTKLFTVLTAVALMATPVFAQEVEDVTETTAIEKKSSALDNFSFAVNFAVQLKPASDLNTTAEGTHFSPVTNFFSGPGGKLVPSVTYTIPTPLGEGFLLGGANVAITGEVEIGGPVTAKPGISVAFTPLPFLVFSAGGSCGTGWDFLGNQGTAVCINTDGNTLTYQSRPLFFYKWYAQGTFQFMTGALISNPWANVVMQYSYQVYQESIAGTNSTYCWQAGYGKTNALAQYMCGILAYQMPVLEFVRVGAMWENNGYYTGFKSNTVSPLVQIQFNKHNNLAILASFQTRNSKDDWGEYSNKQRTVTTTTINTTEWYLDKVAVSYTYSF